MPDIQALQQAQRRQAMAQQLMGNQAQGQNSGMANAGNSILGAVTANRANQDMKFAAQGIAPVQITPQVGTTGLGRLGNKLGGLFGLGGG